jgi:hypothetical protein
LTLITRKRLIARYVPQNFERFILDAWRTIDPEARRVIVKHEAAMPLQQGDDDVAPL